MKRHPIKSDSRYTISQEFCGYPEARFILRFCDEWVDQSLHYSAMVMRAVGHKNVRNSAVIFEEISANKPIKNQLPVRDDVETITYHRQPTESEIRFGHGAIHYANFTIAECCHKGTRFMKSWLKSPHDGLRYYR